MSVLSHGGLVERFFFRFEESTYLIEKERGEKERIFFFLEMKKKKKKERRCRKRKIVEEEGGTRRNKKVERRRKRKRDRVFREVMCGKVVGPCMDKGNVKKNVKKNYFNKRDCIIDNLIRIFLQIDCVK